MASLLRKCPLRFKKVCAAHRQHGLNFTVLTLMVTECRIRCIAGFPSPLEISLPGFFNDNETALRLMREFWLSRISAPTSADALQTALDSGNPDVLCVYNHNI